MVQTNVYTTYKNGDDWGMVYYCLTHISSLPFGSNSQVAKITGVAAAADAAATATGAVATNGKMGPTRPAGTSRDMCCLG